LPKPHNRAGHQLRKEGDVGRELKNIPGRLDDAPVRVDYVGNGVEGVKRNSNGKDDVPVRNGNARACPVEQSSQRVDDKIRVLEEAQHREICRDWDD
jgi:hypothetical protein